MNQTITLTPAQPKTLFKTAGVMALLIAAAGLVDAATSNMGTGATENTATNAAAWMALFRDHPFTAFSCLGLFNIITLSLGSPINLALLQAHRRKYPALAGLAALLFFIGAAVYFSTNAVLPLYALSRQYAAASGETRVMLEAAAQGLLAQGADLSSGTFPGFFFTQAAGLLVAGMMWNNRLFSRWTAAVGLAGFSLTFLFFTLAAFALVRFETALIFGMTGGLFLTAYQILLALHFFRLGK